MTLSRLSILIAAGVMALGSKPTTSDTHMTFGPNNPFYAASTLPFHAPPFDKIKDGDYQPAIEAGMAEQRKEMQAIANNRGRAHFREHACRHGEDRRTCLIARWRHSARVTGANRNPELQKVQDIEAPKLAAQHDAIFLDSKLFKRVAAVYKQRDSLKLDAESLRLVDYYYKKFVHAGANLSDAEKVELKKLNEEESTLSNAFTRKYVAATKDAAYVTTDKAALAGLSDAQIAAAEPAAKERKVDGYVIPLQNTTQQPDLDCLTSARPVRRCSRIPGTAPNVAVRTTRETRSLGWLSCALRKPNCLAIRTTPPGSWKTRWRRLRRRR